MTTEPALPRPVAPEVEDKNQLEDDLLTLLAKYKHLKKSFVFAAFEKMWAKVKWGKIPARIRRKVGE